MAKKDEHAVICRAVEKWFGEGDARVHALRGVDLEIRMGEMAMLAGPADAEKPLCSALSLDCWTRVAANFRSWVKCPRRWASRSAFCFAVTIWVSFSSNTTCFQRSQPLKTLRSPVGCGRKSEGRRR